MIKTLIFGLDLSFSSTGITISYLEDKIGKKIQFFKVIFDDESNKKKQFVPKPIENLNQITYKMPTNILVDDLIMDNENTNNLEQVTTTIKAMICSKKIGIIIRDAIKEFQPNEIIYSIENYIMPQFSGKNQLKTVSGLIMLQGFVREIVIRFSIESNIKLKIFTTTPSNNKLFFTKNGNADKPTMIKSFIENYEGLKLLPEISIEQTSKFNDVVDSFSLMMHGYSEYIKMK